MGLSNSGPLASHSVLFFVGGVDNFMSRASKEFGHQVSLI